MLLGAIFNFTTMQDISRAKAITILDKAGRGKFTDTEVTSDTGNTIRVIPNKCAIRLENNLVIYNRDGVYSIGTCDSDSY